MENTGLLNDLEDGAREGLQAFRDYLHDASSDAHKKAKLGVNVLGHMVRFRQVLLGERVFEFNLRKALSSGADVSGMVGSLEADVPTSSKKGKHQELRS